MTTTRLNLGLPGTLKRSPFASPEFSMPMQAQEPKNVLGGTLQSCSSDPETGFYRTGRCETGPQDLGHHVVCAEMTQEFLQYTKRQGNDLITPRPEMHFPGLEPGDRWCLCATRWLEAVEAGVAPPVVLASTNEVALEEVDLEVLKAHALDASEADDSGAS